MRCETKRFADGVVVVFFVCLVLYDRSGWFGDGEDYIIAAKSGKKVFGWTAFLGLGTIHEKLQTTAVV